MLKKVSLMFFCMILLFAAVALAADTDFEFDADSGTITQYLGDGGDVVIPDALDGVPVVALGKELFAYNSDITSVAMPESIVKIGRRAFHSCSNLTAVNIPKGVKVLPEEAFYMCKLLSEIDLPEGLESIDHYAFYACSAMTKIAIPATVGYIGDLAIADSFSMEKITFHGELPVLGSQVFDAAWAVDEPEIIVPAGLADAYGDALSLPCAESSEVAPALDWKATDIVFDAASGTVTGYEGNRVRVDIPSEIDGAAVTAVGEKAFMHNMDVRILNLPDGLKSIANEAFYGAEIKNIALPESLETIGDEAFCFSRLSGTLIIPEGVREIPKSAFMGANITAAHFPGTIERIGEKAFDTCNVLSYLYFDGCELPEIGTDAFDGAPIADIDIAATATKAQAQSAIEQFAAAGVLPFSGLWRANLADQPDYPFSASFQIEAVSDKVYVMSYEGDLSEMTMYWNWEIDNQRLPVGGLGEGVFAGSTLKRFTVPRNEQFTLIGERAFEGSEIERVDLFDSVTGIGMYAFKDCANLSEIVLPDSIEAIGEGAFEGVPDEAVRVPEDATDEQVAKFSAMLGRPMNRPVLRVGERYKFATMPDSYVPNPASDFEFDKERGAVVYCGTAVDVVIPREIDGVPVRVIGGNAFSIYNMAGNYDDKMYEKLQSVVIPETVEVIEQNAFAECHNLKSVICYGALKKIELRAFENNTSLSEFVLHNGVESIDLYAFVLDKQLKSIDLGGMLDSTSEGTFRDTGLESIVADMRDIGPQTFMECTNLKEVHITKRVERIQRGAFLVCTALESICIERLHDDLFPEHEGILGETPASLKVYVPMDSTDEQIEKLLVTLKTNDFIGSIERRDCERTVINPFVEPIA